MFGTHFFQNIFAGAVDSGFSLLRLLFDFEMFKENFAYLAGGVDVELHPGQLMDFGFHFAEFGSQRLGGLLECDLV